MEGFFQGYAVVQRLFYKNAVIVVGVILEEVIVHQNALVIINVASEESIFQRNTFYWNTFICPGNAVFHP